MSLLYIPLALLVLVYIAYQYFTKNFNYWKKRNVAGPEPIIFFGNILESALRRKNIGVVAKEIYDNFPNEKVVGIYRMTSPCLLIRDLDIVKHIMIKDFDVFTDRGLEFSKDGLGANLFHADGDTWRVLRNRFTPIFTSGKLKNMLYLMTERSDKLMNYLDDLCRENPEQEIHKLVQKYTMATISACAFGVDIDTLHDKLDTLKKVDDIVLNASFAQELDMLYPGILKKMDVSIFPAMVTKFFDELAKSVIKQRNGVPTNRKDFMDLILELRQQGEIQGTKRNKDDIATTVELTDEMIAAQTFVFYVGGYETSATTMAFLFYKLAFNPDVQDKVIAEIDEVLEKYNGKITYDALMDLTYLDKVFSETLRMYPIVDPLLRNAKVDYTIPGTDVTIRKGQTVLIPAFGIHNDEKYYPNPEVFDPDRFDSEQSGDRHPCAYIPFGTGPRNCIGMRFAKLQSRVCITNILSKFRVTPCKNTPKKLEMEPNRIILGPKGGIPLNIIRRKY